MSVDDLFLLFNQNSTNTVKTDKDLDRFCKSCIALYKAAVGQSSVPQRSIWAESDLALALREGADNDMHIDFDKVSESDHKVAIMYRKFGFKGLEGAIEAVGLRKTFAIASLVACLPDDPTGMVPFASSTRSWLERVSKHIKVDDEADDELMKADLEIYCIGPETRRRIAHTTWVVDVIPALHEQILPDSTSPYTLYVPQVHVLVYGPHLQLVRQGLFSRRVEWQPTECLVELLWALALVDNYPESGFETLLSNPESPKKYEAITKKLDRVKKSIAATVAYLERHDMLDAARDLRALVT